MRNVLAEAPSEDLHGIPRRVTMFVSVQDISERDVLDVGCGYGWFELFALSSGVGRITGVEISDRDLATARKHVDSVSVDFEVASVIALPFEDDSFDTVVCWEVIEHIPANTERKALEEIKRVLRPGGVLYLSTPYASIRARLLDPAWWLIGHRHYNLPQLRQFADDAGLKVEILEVRGGRWLMASLLNLHRLSPIT
jgi:2-polyprenyl-3-methyl-5-hydroxy-6-metoxy-1,4-benzoquinol methylase